jgi:PAS domain-containing protein
MLSFAVGSMKAQARAWSRSRNRVWNLPEVGIEMMSAIAQLRPRRSGSPDPAPLAAAMQALPESLAIVASASGLMVYANSAWCGMFECPDPSQLLGRPLEDLIEVDGLSVRPALSEEDRRDSGSEAHLVHTRRDGTHQHLELARTGFRLRGGEFQVIHTRDVSRQNEVERQLQEARPSKLWAGWWEEWLTTSTIC